MTHPRIFMAHDSLYEYGYTKIAYDFGHDFFPPQIRNHRKPSRKNYNSNLTDC
jgi:hypothetical protein